MLDVGDQHAYPQHRWRKKSLLRSQRHSSRRRKRRASAAARQRRLYKAQFSFISIRLECSRLRDERVLEYGLSPHTKMMSVGHQEWASKKRNLQRHETADAPVRESPELLGTPALCYPRWRTPDYRSRDLILLAWSCRVRYIISQGRYRLPLKPLTS